MTHVEPEDILRRALHAAAESVEPATEGLTQIRARLSAPRPLAVAWLIAAWEIVSQFVMLRLEAALDWLGSSLRTAPRTVDGLLYPAAERLQPLARAAAPGAGLAGRRGGVAGPDDQAGAGRIRGTPAALRVGAAGRRHGGRGPGRGRGRLRPVRADQRDLAGRVVRLLVWQPDDQWQRRRNAQLAE